MIVYYIHIDFYLLHFYGKLVYYLNQYTSTIGLI